MLSSSKSLLAQTIIRINGQVLTEDKQPIANANIILKSKRGVLISYKNSDKNGNFLFEIKSSAREFIVETSYLGFQKDNRPIFFKDGLNINLSILLKTTITTLPEVNIVSKPAAVTIKNDTTTYKVSSFLTGNEEVVEDVLKKLPGVEVSENGKITYKGKSISRVLIEGDDLFSKNYQIGTKNVKSGVLNEVQAIENYIDNDKLVGLKKTNETVLNLKIKDDAKNKPNLSASVAYGYKNDYQVDNNLIGVSKSFKYFLFNNMNNIGVNPTPYDYFIFNNTSEEQIEVEANQTKIIGIDYSLPVLSSKRGNINQSYFSTGNAFIRLNKDLNLTANYNFYADKINVTRNSLTEFGALANDISFTEHKLIVKNPLIGNAVFNVLYNISKKSNIKYISNFSIGEITSSEELIANYGTFIGRLRDKTISLGQNLEYTNRISTNSALKIKANYLFLNQPQYYFLNPSLNLIGASLNSQSINFFGTFFNINSEYIYKSRLYIHSFAFQYDRKVEHMTSHLSEDKLYNNNLNKYDDNLNISYSNTIDLNKIQLSAGLFYKLKNLNVSSGENSDLRYNINFPSPSINLQYKINKYDKYILATSYDRFLPELTDLYQNYILVDNKSLTKGFYQKNIIGRYSLVSTFIHSDLFNQLIYFLNVIYTKNSKSYGSSQEINSNYIINNRGIFPGVENYILTGSLSKYLPFIKSTVKYNHNLNWYQLYNQINNSLFRKYSGFNSSQLLDVKSGFDGWFDFEVGLRYNIAKFSLNENRTHDAQLYFNLLIRSSEKLFFSISNELYFNNLTSNNSSKYYFLDINAKYNLNNKMSIRLIGKNITDNRFFNTKIIDQFSSSTNKYSLLPANLLFELSYRF